MFLDRTHSAAMKLWSWLNGYVNFVHTYRQIQRVDSIVCSSFRYCQQCTSVILVSLFKCHSDLLQPLVLQSHFIKASHAMWSYPKLLVHILSISTARITSLCYDWYVINQNEAVVQLAQFSWSGEKFFQSRQRKWARTRELRYDLRTRRTEYRCARPLSHPPGLSLQEPSYCEVDVQIATITSPYNTHNFAC